MGDEGKAVGFPRPTALLWGNMITAAEYRAWAQESLKVGRLMPLRLDS